MGANSAYYLSQALNGSAHYRESLKMITNDISIKMPEKTRNAITKLLSGFPPSSARAQLIAIMGYRLEGGETIADRFLRDHASHCHAFRQAMLLVDAGAATLTKTAKDVHCGNGVFKSKIVGEIITFEDGSQL